MGDMVAERQTEKSRTRNSATLIHAGSQNRNWSSRIMSDTRVLVADDSSTMRKIILRSLSAVGVTNVVEAADGDEAVNLFNAGEFDLVLTDWNMPGKSGLEVIQEIRAKNKDIPIGMVTTEAEKSRLVETNQASVADVPAKPFPA